MLLFCVAIWQWVSIQYLSAPPPPQCIHSAGCITHLPLKPAELCTLGNDSHQHVHMYCVGSASPHHCPRA